LLKYPNLYMMTSAYAPKYLPQELIHFMNTRGPGKVLFASDHPVLSFERCLKEATELPLREGVLERYLIENARELLNWPGRMPRPLRGNCREAMVALGSWMVIGSSSAGLA